MLIIRSYPAWNKVKNNHSQDSDILALEQQSICEIKQELATLLALVYSGDLRLLKENLEYFNIKWHEFPELINKASSEIKSTLDELIVRK